MKAGDRSGQKAGSRRRGLPERNVRQKYLNKVCITLSLTDEIIQQTQRTKAAEVTRTRGSGNPPAPRHLAKAIVICPAIVSGEKRARKHIYPESLAEEPRFDF